MAKRPVDSDDEDYASTSKRAKGNNGAIEIDDDEPMTARPNQRKGKKAKKGEDDSGEVEEDDEGFEEEHGDKIRESVKAKQQIKGVRASQLLSASGESLILTRRRVLPTMELSSASAWRTSCVIVISSSTLVLR